MKKVFLDSSVLVSASASKTGASAYILGLSIKTKLTTYVSYDVIGEARKNTKLKLGVSGIKRLSFFLKNANIILAPHPSITEILKCEEVINPKDAPILAAFIESPANHLITLDKKDFINSKVFNFAKPKKILLPGEFVVKYYR